MVHHWSGGRAGGGAGVWRSARFGALQGGGRHEVGQGYTQDVDFTENWLLRAPNAANRFGGGFGEWEGINSDSGKSLTLLRLWNS